MAKDYSKMAADLLQEIGGASNVSSVTHCATRLRFNLKDHSQVNVDNVKKIAGVITVVEKGGQFQVVIGNTVPEVYRAVVQAGNLDSKQPVQEENAPKGGLVSRFVDMIAGIFPPVLGVMCGSGLIKGILAILVAAKLLTPEMGTYVVINAIGDSVFYFLPVLLGFTAGRKFGGTPYLTALLGAVLIHPTLVGAAASGGSFSFIGIPMVVLNYSSTVIPILFASWVCCKLEKFFNNVIPAAVKNFVTPTLCLLITVPLTLWIIGPITTALANGLADGYQWIFSLSPLIAGAFVGAMWQVLVIFGVHWTFVPLMINNVATYQFDTLGPAAQIAAMSQTGAAFGVMLKMKNQAVKGTTLSTIISGVFGITEPIVYGVTLPRKKVFIAGMIGGCIGGAVGAVIGAAGYSVGAFGLMFLPSTIGPDGLGAPFWGTLVGYVVAFVISAVLAFIIYKDDTQESTI